MMCPTSSNKGVEVPHLSLLPVIIFGDPEGGAVTETIII